MAMTTDTTLEEKVSNLEAKSDRIEKSGEVESDVKRATDSIDQLNRKFRSLGIVADELKFYIAVLELVFEDSRPRSVKRAISTAHRAANIDDEAVVKAAEQQDLSSLYDAIDDAEDELSDAIDTVTDQIEKKYQSPREGELSDARELNNIIGGGDAEFRDTISSINTFLNKTIWNTNNAPQELAVRWEQLDEEWKENSGKHGWDAFQEEHSLADGTIAELKQFTSKDTVLLSDLSITTLREIKQVPELESALQVELKS